MKRKSENAELSVVKIRTGRIECFVVGTSPLVFNAVSAKGWHELLLPRGRKTAADKAENLKHVPIEEYRDSVYAHLKDEHPTRLLFPCGAFKKAMANAALDLPGLKKAQIGRLVWMNERDVDIFGVPMIYMTIVRSADIARTPDVRTRAILPNWACRFSVNYVIPHLNEDMIATLLANAGIFIGIGDGRQEKGAFSNGQFELVPESDARLRSLMKDGGRQAQDRALRDPAPYDLETQRMLSWFDAEIVKIGQTQKAKRRAA